MSENETRMDSDDARMMALVRTFPSLQHQEISDWNPAKLNVLAKTGMMSQMAFHAIAFLLTLWNPCVRDQPFFDFVNAFRSWDDAHRKAFSDWTKDPWWP